MKGNGFTIAEYAKMAAVILLYNVKAEAQVIYTDLDPDIELLIDNETAGVDLDNNGVVDFLFLRTSGTYYTYYFGTELRLRQADWVVPFDNSFDGILGGPATSSNSFNNLAPPLDSSFLISSKKYFQTSSLQIMSFGFYKPTGNWFYGFGFPIWNTLEGTNRFLGVRFSDSEDCIHYGWIRCEIEDSCKRLIVKDYAYELTCDYPIAAGSKESYVGIENGNTLVAQVYSFNNTIFVNVELNNAVLRLNNLEGKEIYQIELKNQFTQIPLDVATGIYFVEIIAKEGKFIKKIYLN